MTRCPPRLVLIAGLLLATAGPSPAQGPPPAVKGFDPYLALLLNGSVREELGVSKDQATKMSAVSVKVVEKHREDFERLRESAGDDPSGRGLELLMAMSRETSQGLKQLLTPEQQKRLQQVELQERGLRAFADPDVARRLQLTVTQRQGLQAISARAAKEMTKVFKASARQDFDEFEQKRLAVRKQAVAEAVELLDDDQRDAWKDLVGEPFEVRWQGPPGPRKAAPEAGNKARDTRTDK